MPNFKEKLISGLLPFLFGIAGVVLSMLALWYVLENISKNISDDKRPECTQADIYNFQHSDMKWGQCINGKQTRKLKEKESFSCKNPGKVETPNLERNCELSIPTCTEDDFEFSKWSECSKEGKRDTWKKRKYSMYYQNNS